MREWLPSYPYEIDDVTDVGRIVVFVELAGVPGVDEQRDRLAKGGKGAGEATAATPQTSEIVPQFGVIAFDAVRLALAGATACCPGE